MNYWKQVDVNVLIETAAFNRMCFITKFLHLLEDAQIASNVLASYNESCKAKIDGEVQTVWLEREYTFIRVCNHTSIYPDKTICRYPIQDYSVSSLLYNMLYLVRDIATRLLWKEYYAGRLAMLTCVAEDMESLAYELDDLRGA